MLVTISEARLNDLVYMVLKKLFFEGLFGKGTNPRECDIRVVMNLVAPSTWEGNPIAAAILSPTEKSPGSHNRQYAIETDNVFDSAVEYMEDHWMKQTWEEAVGDTEIKPKAKEYYAEIVKAVMGIPEEQCGPQAAS